MRKEKLDFIIVGAQKAGTTSLADHLNNSRHIYIPAEKEVPYFLEPVMQQRGWRWYLNTFFGNADPSRLWGTSTPQYMMHPECFKAIGEALPDVKIIVTLRDPVRRLVSHFDMATRLGVEKRHLNDVLGEQIRHAEKYRAIPYPDHTGKYVASGEYGRILNELYRHFPRSQVLVLFFDDIVRNLQNEIDKICDFLTIEKFTIVELERISMQGGAKKRLPVDHGKVIRAVSKAVRVLGLSEIIPDSLKKRVGRTSSWLDEWNVDPTSKTDLSAIPPDLLLALRQHYAQDAILLERDGVSPPWIKP